MILRTVYLLMAGFLVVFCSCTTEHSKIVLAEFGDYKITMSEFENAYAKNAGGYENAKDDSLSKLKNFLDLYLNFKMKLRDAQVRKYDENPALLAELNDYKEKVGVTYLLEKKLVEPALQDLYERRKWEYRASHIMFRIGPGHDEAEAEKKAHAVMDSIKAGADFEEMAKRHSQDQFSAQFGGDLFYITAGLLPVEFEDAVYKTETGQIYPEVVRTNFGYHIIKVTDKRERIPAIHASHILIDYRNENNEIDTAAARAKIDSVLNLIRNGEDFVQLASEVSEDPGTKDRGGDLGFFERRQMVKEFDEAAFNLDVNEISDVVQTNFGFHIIKLLEKKPYPTFEEEKANLKKLFERQNYAARKDEFISDLRTKYNYAVNEETLDFILSKSDSVMLDDNHPSLPEFKDKVLFTFAGNSVTVGEFFEKLPEKKDYHKKIITEELLNNAVNAVSEDYVLREEAFNLEKTDSVFADLMDDYRNGIYIFKLQEDEVWNKIEIDSVKLYEYYQVNKENFRYPDRVSFAEIFSVKDSVINHYYELLKAGADFDSLASLTERAAMKDKGGIYSLNDVKTSVLYEEANKLEKPGDFSEPIKVSGGYSIVKLIEKDPARVKTFEEARAEVAGAFQESESKRLENEYLERLKKRYEPSVYYSELEKAFVEEK